MSLGSNGVDQVCSLRKLSTRLRGTNFCSSSAYFASSFVRQPNGSKYTRIVQNAPKHEFRVQWGGSVCSSRKLSMRLRGTNFCSSSAYFAPSFVRQPNGSKYTRIVQNAPKHEFRVQWGGSGAIVATNSDVTLCYEHLHLFSLFCTEFHKPTKLSQMHPNSTKRDKT